MCDSNDLAGAHGRSARPVVTTELGRRLRALLHRPEVFDLLPGGTWTQGGCWALADGLARWFGPRASLRMTVCEAHRGACHAVCEVDGLYLDADGAQTEARLLRKMAKLEWCLRPRLVAFDADAMRGGEAFEPRPIAAALLPVFDEDLRPLAREG